MTFLNLGSVVLRRLKNVKPIVYAAHETPCVKILKLSRHLKAGECFGTHSEVQCAHLECL